MRLPGVTAKPLVLRAPSRERWPSGQYIIVNVHDDEIEAVSTHLRNLALNDCSPLTALHLFQRYRHPVLRRDIKQNSIPRS